MASEKGFTYIEVLIAMAVLTIFIIPMTVVFSQSGLQLKYAYKQYEASLLAENLLTEAGNVLASGKIIRGDEDFQEFLGALDFAEDYNLKEYDFVLHVDKITTDSVDGDGNGNIVILATNPALVKTGNVIFSTTFRSLFSSEQYQEDASADETIVYDGGFRTRGGSYGAVMDGRYVVTIPNTQQQEVNLKLSVSNIDEDIGIVVQNQSAKNIFLIIYRDSEEDEQFVHVEYRCDGTGSMLTQYVKPKSAQYNCMAVVDVYDKQQKLIKRAARTVFYE